MHHVTLQISLTEIAITLHSLELIFKIIIEIQVQGNLNIILKVISHILMTLFSGQDTGAVLSRRFS